MFSKDESVKPGVVKLLANAAHYLRDARVGVLAHAASVLPDRTYTFDRLIDHDQVRVTALFGPEHGITGDAQDQIAVEEKRYRGCPVHSLYGNGPASLVPTEAAFGEIDVLVVDLQDVGSRYYTYVYTMAHAIQAAARLGKRVIVCDRPNPINGGDVEGPVLEARFASFVGRFPLPVRHGKTIGELAAAWNEEYHWGADLTVLPVENWERWMWFNDTRLPWVPPSPNMPILATATVYPGGCLLEGTNLSEGRGTTRPFETMGAPWLDGREWAAALNERQLPGVFFRPVEFTPTFNKYAGRTCGGVFVHVTDRQVFRPFATYIHAIVAARALGGGQFAWHTGAYEFESDRLAFDLLCGTDRIRLAIDAGQMPAWGE